MSDQTWAFDNRKGWGPGEWDNEPFDKVFWIDDATGLPCLCHRSPMGNWNGYVAVPQSHPLFGVDYSVETPILAKARAALLESTDAEMTTTCIIECLAGELGCSPGSILECHGGLTFAAENKPSATSKGVWIASDKPLWWFGFDCGHLGDFSPGLARFSPQLDGTYRTLGYVREQVIGLARQLAAVSEVAP